MLPIALIKQIAARAAEAAATIPCPMSIAIVDAGANLVYLERMDNALIASAEVAQRKARCAMLYNRPTKAFEDAIAAGRTALTMLPDILPLEGGVPLIKEGKVVGAIGASGGTAQQDGAAATAGAEFLASLVSNSA